VIITTSRDPSPGTRRYARALASFLSRPYINRGKSCVSQGDEEGESVLVVVEDHGNPSGIVKRISGEEKRICFRLSGEVQSGRMKKRAPGVCGEGSIAVPIASFFELPYLGQCAPAEVGRQEQDRRARGNDVAGIMAVNAAVAAGYSRIISVASGCIDFIYEGSVRFRLKI